MRTLSYPSSKMNSLDWEERLATIYRALSCALPTFAAEALLVLVLVECLIASKC